MLWFSFVVSVGALSGTIGYIIGRLV